MKPHYVGIAGLTFVLIAMLLVGMDVQAAFYVTTGQYQENEDIIVAWINSAAIQQYDALTLERYADTDNDGTVDTVGSIVSQNNLGNCNGASVSPHLACTALGALHAQNMVIFKNGSTEHISGNYTLYIRTETNLGQIIDLLVHSFTIHPQHASVSQVTSESQGTRTRINDTNCLANACTDYLASRVNTTSCIVNACTDYLASLVNATSCVAQPCTNYLASRFNDTISTMTTQHANQDATHGGNGNGGCGVDCQQNISTNTTANVTAAFSLFTTDCHGTSTNLCINGHTPNVVIDNTIYIVACFIILGFLVWASIQGGYGFPMLALLGGLAYMLALFYWIDAFQSQATWLILMVLGLVPMYLGGMNLRIIHENAQKTRS